MIQILYKKHDHIFSATLSTLMRIKLFIYLLVISAGVYASYLYNTCTIKNIYIEGCQSFSAKIIHHQLFQSIQDNHTHLPHLQQLVLKNDFVDSCAIRFQPPHSLYVHIKEKTAIAYNINNELISNTLSIIKTVPIYKAALPKISGTEYEFDLLILLQILLKYNLQPSLSVCIRQGRWNLNLNGKIVKLPPNNIELGIRLLNLFKTKHPEQFLSATQIDLRKLGYAIYTQTSIEQMEDWLSNV